MRGNSGTEKRDALVLEVGGVGESEKSRLGYRFGSFGSQGNSD